VVDVHLAVEQIVIWRLFPAELLRIKAHITWLTVLRAKRARIHRGVRCGNAGAGRLANSSSFEWIVGHTKVIQKRSCGKRKTTFWANSRPRGSNCGSHLAGVQERGELRGLNYDGEQVRITQSVWRSHTPTQ
jgi:hypothetical protein